MFLYIYLFFLVSLAPSVPSLHCIPPVCTSTSSCCQLTVDNLRQVLYIYCTVTKNVADFRDSACRLKVSLGYCSCLSAECLLVLVRTWHTVQWEWRWWFFLVCLTCSDTLPSRRIITGTLKSKEHVYLSRIQFGSGSGRGCRSGSGKPMLNHEDPHTQHRSKLYLIVSCLKGTLAWYFLVSELDYDSQSNAMS